MATPTWRPRDARLSYMISPWIQLAALRLPNCNPRSLSPMPRFGIRHGRRAGSMADMDHLRTAIELLEKNNWEAAHEIVQNDSSTLGSWAHGIVHILEGDLANAGYWYRRADRELPGNPEVGSEIAALKAAAA